MIPLLHSKVPEDVLEAVQWARDNDAQAAEMARKAQGVAVKYLSNEVGGGEDRSEEDPWGGEAWGRIMPKEGMGMRCEQSASRGADWARIPLTLCLSVTETSLFLTLSLSSTSLSSSAPTAFILCDLPSG